MPVGFRDVQFPTNISRGSTSTTRFKTRIISSESGQETRIKVWTYPLRSYDLAVDFWDSARLQVLISFYNAVACGDAYSFRFKDWSDYFAGYKFDPTAGLIVDTGSLSTIGTGDGSTTVFQLSKTYSSGGFSSTRIITKPVNGTVSIYKNGVLQTLTTHYTVDHSTGLVTFVTAPANTNVITAAFQFDVNARFDGDNMALNVEAIQAGKWSSVKVVEVRE